MKDRYMLCAHDQGYLYNYTWHKSSRIYIYIYHTQMTHTAT